MKATIFVLGGLIGIDVCILSWVLVHNLSVSVVEMYNYSFISTLYYYGFWGAIVTAFACGYFLFKKKKPNRGVIAVAFVALFYVLISITNPNGIIHLIVD